MKPQPSYAQAGSVYYICLLRDELLLHQGEKKRKNLIGYSSEEIYINTAAKKLYSAERSSIAIKSVTYKILNYSKKTQNVNVYNLLI